MNGIKCFFADVPLRNYSLTHSLSHRNDCTLLCASCDTAKLMPLVG